MRILVALNAFKGTASSSKLNKVVSKILSKKHSVLIKNISDGGDGFIDCFKKNGIVIKKIVTGPLYDMKVKAKYVLDSKVAYIEIAEASGIRYLKKNQLDIINATTYGVGELIIDAVRRGAKEIYIGLGGTASNDCGFGMARALGIRFLDGYGDDVENNIYGMINIKKIDFSKFNISDRIKFYGVCDVKNRLLGKYGSARVFGPQKGASETDIETIEKALKNLTIVLKKETGRDISKIYGGAAAGGLGAGLYGFLNSKIISGSDFIFKKLKFLDDLKRCDLVITGEGRLDRSTFYGKITGEIIRVALKHKKRIIFITAVDDYKKRIKGTEIINLSKKYEISYLTKNITDAIEKEASVIGKML
ncbi:MAG: glycerate kinase [Elusimicrobiales bacterium]|nr:glycerate kinase [Elusimicrobiales bacterium]